MRPAACPDPVAVTPPSPTVVVTGTPGAPVERVCVEDATGYAETFLFFPPHTEGDTVVQLGTGADIAAMSVNAEWGELPMTLPATGGSVEVIALAVALFSAGLVFGRVGRRR